MKVLIAGAGRLGTRVAHVLAAADNEVTVVERDSVHAETLRSLPVRRVVVGDAGDPAQLERAGALACDLLVACTGADEDNLVISLLAKRRFSVPRVAARVVDPENTWLFDDRWGVDAAVPETQPLVSLIEEASGSADTVALLRLARAGVGVIETVITHRSSAEGSLLGDVALPPGTVVATVVRDGSPTAPEPALRLRPGDEVLLVSHAASAEEIDTAFQNTLPRA